MRLSWLGNFTINAGLRFDRLRWHQHGQTFRAARWVIYLVKPTGTVLRASYTRAMETPYNENLVLSSSTGVGGLASNVFGAVGDRERLWCDTRLDPRCRNLRSGSQPAAYRRA